MFSEEENLPNKNEHSDNLLICKHAPYQNVDLGPWKEALLFIFGNVFTLSLISTIIGAIAYSLNELDKKCVTTLVAYSVIFILLMLVVRIDIKKYLKKFVNWVPYVVGLAFGIGVLLFDELYLRFINIFYTTGTGGNETGIRMIISRFPALSLIIFGLIGPMCEELTYRVGVFNIIKRWNKVAAYILTALIFGFIHMDFSGNIATEFIILPTYLFPGILFSIAYDMYDLPCSYTAHITNNLFVIIQLLIRYNS